MSKITKEYKRVTTNSLIEMKVSNEKISMLTAYDYSMASVVDAAKVDVILVGDSASNVMSGHETTVPITLDQMIYHASGVVKASKRALSDVPSGMPHGVPRCGSRESERCQETPAADEPHVMSSPRPECQRRLSGFL